MVAVVLLSAFLVGAVPFAWLTVRLAKGQDVRAIGRGNAAPTHASRPFPGRGAQLGACLAVYALDAGKGFGAAAWGLSAHGDTVGALAGAAAILGHVFTPFLGFRGGKGVATATGVLLALDWRVAAIAIGVFFAVRFTTGQVFLGSLALGVALAGAAIALDPAGAFAGRMPLTGLCLCLAVFLFWTHRGNLRRFFAARAARGS